VRKIFSYLLFPLAMVAGMATAALAQSQADEPILDLARPVLDAIMAGQWWLAVAAGLVLAGAAFAKYAPWAWAKTGFGKLGAVFAMAFGGALVTGFAGGEMSPALAFAALKVGAGAVSLYEVAKTLLAAAAKAGWMPGWLARAAEFLYAALSNKAVRDAEKAGDVAVAAKPPTGAEGVVGFIRELK
jgi:hypothetical protein